MTKFRTNRFGSLGIGIWILFGIWGLEIGASAGMAAHRPHLHALLGSPFGNVIGGHLFKATVFTTVEIVMGKVAGSLVCKAKSEVTGLMELLKK